MPKKLSAEIALPFTLRLTPTERVYLERKAAGLPLGEYIRLQSLKESRIKRLDRGKSAVKAHQPLVQLLSELGRLRVANNLTQLTDAINSGALELPHEITEVLTHAHIDICKIRTTLLQVIGNRRYPIKDHELLGQLLDDLKRMRVANNLNRMAKAVNSGSFVLTPETTIGLLEACADIREIRGALTQSLGRDG